MCHLYALVLFFVNYSKFWIGFLFYVWHSLLLTIWLPCMTHSIHWPFAIYGCWFSRLAGSSSDCLFAQGMYRTEACASIFLAIYLLLNYSWCLSVLHDVHAQNIVEGAWRKWWKYCRGGGKLMNSGLADTKRILVTLYVQKEWSVRNNVSFCCRIHNKVAMF